MIQHTPTVSRWIACLLTGWLALPSSAFAAQENWRLVAPRACFFGGEQAELTIELADGLELPDRIAWSLEADSRVLDRGTSRAQVAPPSAGNDADRRRVAIPLPAVTEGVVLRVEGKFTTPDGGSLSHTIWVYPRQAFPTHDRWWEANPIHVLDPSGNTTALLESQGLPFRPLRGLAAIDPNSPGVVLVGQGVSLVEHPGLAGALIEAARNGAHVLCLAPHDGDWSMDFQDATPELTLRSAGALTQYDKRFDPLGVACPLKLVAHRDQVVLRCGEGPWSWLDLNFEESAGRLLVCGLDLCGGWEDAPVPRHLLSGMLKQLATNASHKELE